MQDAPEAGCFSWLPMCKLAEVQLSIIVTSVNGLKKKGARSLSKYKFEERSYGSPKLPELFKNRVGSIYLIWPINTVLTIHTEKNLCFAEFSAKIR